MKDTFYYVSISVGIGIIVLLIWNIILHNRRISNRRRIDERYYEIKYQQQFYVAIFATVIAALSFLGYDKYSEIESTIKKDIEKQTDSIIDKSKNEFELKLSSIKEKQSEILIESAGIKETNSLLKDNSEKTNQRFYDLLNQFISLKKDLVTSEIELQSQIKNLNNATVDINKVKNDIDGIKKIDFLNQVYLVPNRAFKADLEKPDTIYFKDLTTINKGHLPEFKNPPSVIVSPYTSASLVMTDVTNDYLILRYGNGVIYKNEDEWKYDLLIIYKEGQ